MSWADIRKTNRRRSARKAKRERYDAERQAMHARLGGPVKVSELRAAKRETREVKGSYTTPFQCEIWTFRGREWRMWIVGDEYAAVPHEEWRTDPSLKEWAPLTAGARKWLVAEWNRAEALAASGG